MHLHELLLSLCVHFTWCEPLPLASVCQAQHPHLQAGVVTAESSLLPAAGYMLTASYQQVNILALHGTQVLSMVIMQLLANPLLHWIRG